MFVYVALTAVLGRPLITQIDTAVAKDAGDPLLTAAILHWNARHVPLTEAWWQFPIFAPTRDTLAFSEHLLGVSVVATPIAWLTGNPIAAYNITLLLSFPLAAIAMFALVRRLTGSGAAAFVAGLAFAFAPYRMATLSHIQILSAWWAPLALLGLHEFVSGRLKPAPTDIDWRGGHLQVARWRWLALYGAGWMLQGAANSYALIFFSVLIGLWVVWFVIAPRRWRDLAAIAAATAIASLPLIPLLARYATVHAEHGFERTLDEMHVFSADLGGVLCAPATLGVWGWVRVACRGEGEIFPGVAIAALSVVALLLVLRRDRPVALKWMTRLLAAVAAAYGALVLVVLTIGPLVLDAGLFRISATSLAKPLLIGMAAACAALLLSLAARARTASSATAFYLFAAIATWALALGPTIIVGGESSGRTGPFALLAALPGGSSIRVPARFWLMTMLCLAVVAGWAVAWLVRGRTRAFTAAFTLFASAAVLADGWMGGIPAQPPPEVPPDVRALAGQRVLTLPIEPYPDIAATWHAVIGEWRAVNGYSGNAPRYYDALASAAALEDDAVFEVFRRDEDLHVVVSGEAIALKRFVERQPGAKVIARGSGATQYLLPRRPSFETGVSRAAIGGVTVRSECSPAELALLQDDNDRTQWGCPAGQEQAITIDIGRPRSVRAVVYGLGRYHWEFATAMSIETSLDGLSWTGARRGPILREVIDAGLQAPRQMPVMLVFPPRQARYLRVRPIDQRKDFRWSIAELGVLGD